MSRDAAIAARPQEALPALGLNRLLERQLAEARRRNGEIDLGALLRIVSFHYDRVDD